MAYITNRARAPRVVYIAGANGPVGRTIAPGETASDVELHNAKDPVTAAWIKAGELVVSQNEPSAPGENQPSQDELMAAWREKQARDAAPQGGDQQQSGGGQAGQDAGGQQNGGGQTIEPEFEGMSDDELRTFLVAREVTPGNWGRPRLLREAETVKDVPPTKAA